MVLAEQKNPLSTAGLDTITVNTSNLYMVDLVPLAEKTPTVLHGLPQHIRDMGIVLSPPSNKIFMLQYFLIPGTPEVQLRHQPYNRNTVSALYYAARDGVLYGDFSFSQDGSEYAKFEFKAGWNVIGLVEEDGPPVWTIGQGGGQGGDD